MISRHYGFATRQTYHGFVGQQDFFHHFLFVGISTTAISQVMLRAGAHTFSQIALLQSLYEGGTQHGREVSVFAIRFFQTVEAGHSTYIHHGRKRQYASHLAQGGTRLQGLHFGQLGVERAGLSYLLGVDGGTRCVDAREHFFVEEGWDAVRGVVH